MQLCELKKWPKIWKIAEKEAKKHLKEDYNEKESLSSAFTWSDTKYSRLFSMLDLGKPYITLAKKQFPQMFTSESKIYELW